VVSGVVQRRNRAKLAFVFPRGGNEYCVAGLSLYETQPTFRAVLDDFAEIASPYLPAPLTAMLSAEGPDLESWHEALYAQVMVFALEYALARLWQAWGIEPDRAIGYGVGGFVAACVTGALPVEEALSLVAVQARRTPVARGCGLDVAPYPLAAVPGVFEPEFSSLVEAEFSIFLEVGPIPGQTWMRGGHLPRESTQCYLPTLNPGDEDWLVILNSLAELYIRGRDVDWMAFDRDYPRRRVPLPTYPFERQRYWID
jgi:acyl transferase domain-containing protein